MKKMAKQLSDEWLAADLALWRSSSDPVEVPPTYLRMLINEIQRQRKAIKILDEKIDNLNAHWI